MVRYKTLGNKRWDPIEVSPFRFPGREIHVRTDKLDTDDLVLVEVDTCTPDDIAEMMLFADACERNNVPILGASIPYLPGARQDRALANEPLSAVVYARMINACGFEKIVCVDPHSDVMPAQIKNLIVVPIEEIIFSMLGGKAETFAGVIAPDSGATKKAFRVAQALEIPMFQALKHRDMKTGKLSHFSCEKLPKRGKFLVVDDICDGGGTFKGLAKTIDISKKRLTLCVTHGVFSDGAHELGLYYDEIYSTNSHYGSDSYNICQVRERGKKGNKNNHVVFDVFPELARRQFGTLTGHGD